MKTIVVGLGNPILGDDGAGWWVAEELKKKIDPEGEIHIESACLGGIALMELLEGYPCAILVDALQTHQGTDGCVKVFALDALPSVGSKHFSSVHDASLPTALKTGREIGLELPKIITIVAIEATIVNEFSDELSAAVACAIPVAVQAVLDLIHSPEHMGHGGRCGAAK